MGIIVRKDGEVLYEGDDIHDAMRTIELNTGSRTLDQVVRDMTIKIGSTTNQEDDLE